MKLLSVVLLLLVSLSCPGQNFTLHSEQHNVRIAADGSSFTDFVEYRGKMSAGIRQTFSVYFGEEEELENLRVTYTAKNGKIVVLKKKDLVLSSAPSRSFYTGGRLYSFILPAQPSAYEFTYSYRITNPHLMFLSALWFERQSPAHAIKWSINVPPAYDLAYRINDRDEHLSLQENVLNSGIEYVFTEEITADAAAKSVVRIIVFARGSRPAEYFNAQYIALTEPHSHLSADTKAYLDGELADLTDRESKIAGLFAMVQERISYIDFENGIGAIQPRDVNKIFAEKQGDCKDMSNLLVQSLRYAGIEAYLAISSTLSHYTDFDFPTLSSGNHCICVVPQENGYLFLDATESQGAYGLPARHIQGRNVFVVREKEGEIVRVPPVPAARNAVHYALELNAEKTDLRGKAAVRLHGLSRLPIDYAAGYTDEARIKGHLQQSMTAEAENLLYDEIEITAEDTVLLSADIRAKRVLTDLGNKAYLSLNFLPFPHRRNSAADTVKIINYQTRRDSVSARLHFPAPVTLQPFEPVAYRAGGLEFTFSATQIAPAVVLLQSLYVNENLITEGEELAAYRRTEAIIEELLRSSLVFKKQ